MAGIAGLRIEAGDVVGVTIGTHKRFTRDLELVPF